MSEVKLKIRDTSGGVSTTGERKAKPFAARFIKNLNIYESPDYITLSKVPTKVSGANVTDLIYWGVDGSPYDTNKYFLSDGGKFYRETNSAVWSSLRTVSGCAGEGLAIFDDYAYYALDTELGRYGRLSGTPAFDDDLTSWWDGAITDIQTSGGGTGSADYVPPTTIAETATARQTFTSEGDPLKEITIDVDVAGTGNWTVTVHDSENNLIGAKTLANASISAADITFTFATALRLVIGNSYHFHVTSTVADGGVDTDAATDLEGAEFTAEYGVLISAEFHPMAVVEDKLIIGNDSYLAVFDQSTYNPNKVLLERGFKVRSITKQNEYIVASCYKGASVDEAEESRNFYWDTISPSWNFFSDTTSIGAANALTNSGNKLIGIYGNRGGLYEGDSPAQKLFEQTPKLARGKVLNVFPSAISDLDGITLIGVGGSTDDSTGLEQGIYAYGSENSAIPDALVLLYLISTGTTQGTTLKIGMVKVFGDDIYYSWRDNTSYGVDKISPDANACTSGTYSSLIFDNSDTNKSKLLIHQVSTYEALASGQTVTNKSKLERTASFTGGTASSTVGDVKAKDIFNKRFKEIEAGFTITSSGGTFPKLTQHEVLFNDLKGEGFNE